MADKKVIKKTTKEAQIVSSLPLAEQLVQKKTELLTAKQGLGSTLQNPHVIKTIKKDIARIMTKINQSETKTSAQESSDSPKKGAK